MGRTLSTAEERELCRYCYGLALFDEILRAGRNINSPLDKLPPSAGVGDLLAIASDASVTVSARWPPRSSTAERALLAGKAVLKPTFSGSRDIGGADADLIVDRVLIDVKAAVDPGDIRKRWWPWQLLGYTLLDYADEYQIDSVGLYLARQALLIKWPLGEFMAKLAQQQVKVKDLRDDLRKLLRSRTRHDP